MRGNVGFVAIAFGAFATLCPTAPAAAGSVGGWITYWDFHAGMASVERNAGKVEDVLLFAGRLDAFGAPVLAKPAAECREAIRRLRAWGATPWLTVTNDRVDRPGSTPVLKDADLVHAILADPTRQRAHRRAIVELAESLDAQGVDIDYENLAPEDREAFSAFALRLADELHEKGLMFSITVQPKTGESRARGPGAMDWRALCAGGADRVQVMLYNQHNAATPPGPVAEPDWIEAVLRYGAGHCPPDRLVPVLKVIGMDWGPDKAEWVDHATAVSRATRAGVRIRRVREGKTPWFAYSASHDDHVLYFEDAKSLRAKMEVAARLGHRRIVLWALGSEDPTFLPEFPTQKR